MKGMGDQISRIKEQIKELELQNKNIKQESAVHEQKLQQKTTEMNELIAKRQVRSKSMLNSHVL